MVNSLLQRMKASIYQSTCLAIQGGFLLGGSLDLEYYEEVAGVCLAFRLLSTLHIPMDTNDPVRRDVSCVKIDCIALGVTVKGIAVQVVFSFTLLEREGIELQWTDTVGLYVKLDVQLISTKIHFNDQGTIFEV